MKESDSPSNATKVWVANAAHARRPARVTLATGALALAWVISAVALAINQLLLHGSSIGPGPLVGVASLIVQALLIAFVARGNAIARIVVVLFFVLAASPLAIVPRLVAQHSAVSASYLVLGFLLKGAATFLLFTGDSRVWFTPSAPARRRSPVASPNDGRFG